jgi:hypothetical protein
LTSDENLRMMPSFDVAHGATDARPAISHGK